VALERVKPMDGWILLSDAARLLGVSRQAVYEAVDAGRITTARYLGEERRVYAMRRAEIPEVRAKLSASHQERARRSTGERDAVQAPDTDRAGTGDDSGPAG
jgi:excisionase family DNA binding protein